MSQEELISLFEKNYMRFWPECLEPGCKNKCLRLESQYCHVHEMARRKAERSFAA